LKAFSGAPRLAQPAARIVSAGAGSAEVGSLIASPRTATARPRWRGGGVVDERPFVKFERLFASPLQATFIRQQDEVVAREVRGGQGDRDNQGDYEEAGLFKVFSRHV
jgi:hypothetical protein